MSRENIELARQLVEALNRRDLSQMLALADPEVEWHSFFATLGSGGVYRGPDGTRNWMSDLDDAWEVVRADVDQIVEVGNVVLLLGRIHYRGRGSGIESEDLAGWVLRFRQGRVLYYRAFREPEEALGAVGLSE